MSRKIHIIGGGTVFHVRPHFAICTPTNGETVWTLAGLIREHTMDFDVHTHTTRMAGNYAAHLPKGDHSYLDLPRRDMETNADIAAFVQEIVADPDTKILFLPAAIRAYPVVA